VFSLPALSSPFYARGAGVVVVAVEHDAAVRGPTGLVPGDVITAVNDVEVSFKLAMSNSGPTCSCAFRCRVSTSETLKV
jgi:hypothetical protein